MKRMSQYGKSLDDLRMAMRKLKNKTLDVAVHMSDETEASITEALGDPDYFGPLLKALPHLKIEEGWRLDAEFVGHCSGGKLAFFATDGRMREEIVRHVESDGSAESVWELRLLLYCVQVFYLHQHAIYGILHIVTALRGMNQGTVRIESDMDDVLQKLKPEDRRRLEAWDIAPSVEVDGNEATIRYCTFSPFGGGFRKIREKIRVRPYEIIKGDVEDRIPYDCGIRV